MKQLPLIISSIALIGVIYLISQQKSGTTSDEIITKQTSEKEPDLLAKNKSIAYINIDSLQGNYKLYEQMIDQLNTKRNGLEQSLSRKQKSFETKIKEFQQKAPTMTQFEGQMKQEELAKEEKQLYALREKYAKQIAEEEVKLNKEFNSTVKSFIESYNKQENYDIIIHNHLITINREAQATIKSAQFNQPF